MTARHRRYSQRGLTLIEVLVALVLFSMLSLGSFRLLNSTAGIVSQASAVANSVQQEGRAMSIIAADMRHIVPVSGGFSQTVSQYGSGSNPAVSLTSGNSIEFSRANNNYLPGVSRSSVVLLRYRLAAQQGSEKMALIREHIGPDNNEASIGPQILLADVSAFEVRMQDKSGAWHRQWPIQNAAPEEEVDLLQQAKFSIPSAIEVTLNTDNREMHRFFSMR